MVSQPLTAVGRTHASSVIPVVSRSEAASAMSTRALVPLNARAPPYLPAVDHVALTIVPLWPLPEVSVSVLPRPRSKLYEATGWGTEIAAEVVNDQITGAASGNPAVLVAPSMRAV